MTDVGIFKNWNVRDGTTQWFLYWAKAERKIKQFKQKIYHNIYLLLVSGLIYHLTEEKLEHAIRQKQLRWSETVSEVLWIKCTNYYDYRVKPRVRWYKLSCHWKRVEQHWGNMRRKITFYVNQNFCLQISDIICKAALHSWLLGKQVEPLYNLII